MLKTIICAIALAASLPAAATDSDPLARQEVVRFDDLNLATSAGVAALERRIQSAVRRVCGYQPGRGSGLIYAKEVADCMATARASAQEAVAAKTGTAIRKG